jgi:phosphate transport system protein
MHVRRLVKAGQASHTVSLPKEWLEKNKLAKGATVYVHETSGNELRITPHLNDQPAEQKTVMISTNDKNIDTIQREITAAYVNNAGTIEITGTNLAQYANEIRKSLHDFVALEIAEQTPTKISAKDLLNLQEISVSKSLTRMDNIVRTMLQDCILTAQGKDLSQSVMLRDYDVNRLYFLLTRLLKSALSTPAMASRLQLKPTAVLQNWMLVHYLEQLADTIKSLCTACTKTPIKQRKQTTELIINLEADYRDTMKAMHEHNKTLADEVARKHAERQQAINSLAEENPGPAHHCSALSSTLTETARLIIDEEN